MTAPETTPAIASEAAALLQAFATRPSDVLEQAVKLLYTTLKDRGTCALLAELGDEATVRAELLGSGVVGLPGDYRPLIIDGPRLYAHRYHRHESTVAAAIGALLDRPQVVPPTVEEQLRPALQSGITFITGGPGTGKTTLVAKVLTALSRPDAVLDVALMAPTGKAAARLAESVDAHLPLAVRPLVRRQSGTIHRILGALPPGLRFRHGPDNPLRHSLVVLDEASMIDLPLMARLLSAIDPSSTRLLVVGDPDQLPAIQAGSVLGDISDAARRLSPEHRLSRAFIRLQRNWRAGDSPGLSALVRAIQAGDADAVLGLLEREQGVKLCPVPESVEAFVSGSILPRFQRLAEVSAPAEALAELERFRLICALRQGPYGVGAINRLMLDALSPTLRRDGAYFHGMPLIISRNDPATGLANGETGVVLAEGGHRWAWFPGHDGPRPVSIQRLPPHEPAYALTVHRSQGSEFQDVAVLFPPEDHPLLSREMLYTAASRARRSLAIHASAPTLRAALSRRALRASGLSDRLIAAAR